MNSLLTHSLRPTALSRTHTLRHRLPEILLGLNIHRNIIHIICLARLLPRRALLKRHTTVTLADPRRNRRHQNRPLPPAQPGSLPRPRHTLTDSQRRISHRVTPGDLAAFFRHIVARNDGSPSMASRRVAPVVRAVFNKSGVQLGTVARLSSQTAGRVRLDIAVSAARRLVCLETFRIRLGRRTCGARC